MEIQDLTTHSRAALDVRASLGKAIEAMVRPVGGTSDQLGRIASELICSVVNSAIAAGSSVFESPNDRAAFVEAQQKRLTDFLRAIPPAFHHWGFTDEQGVHMSPYEMSAENFSNVVERISTEPAKQLLRSYQVVWRHGDALSETRKSDQVDRSHSEYYLNPEVGMVEAIALEYLASPDFISPVLEWAIVDALIYVRIREFGRSRKYWDQLGALPADQLLNGPFLGAVDASDTNKDHDTKWGAISLAAAKIIAYLFGEAIAVAITWFAAIEITNDRTQAWIFFTGFTASRWIIQSLRQYREIKPEKEVSQTVNMQMLWDMAITYERVPGMNVGLLRHLLYRLEEKGAAFSPMVYSILDRKAERKSKV